MIEKTSATILGIIYHPEIRHVLTEQGKKDIAEMVRMLADGLSNCPFLQCGFIENFYPNASKIELFAREHRDGWNSWGDELIWPKNNVYLGIP